MSHVFFRLYTYVIFEIIILHDGYIILKSVIEIGSEAIEDSNNGIWVWSEIRVKNENEIKGNKIRFQLII